MGRVTCCLCLFAAVAAAQRYRAEPGGAPSGEFSEAVRGVLEQRGVRVVAERGFTFCEIWYRSAPLDSSSLEEALSSSSIPRGTLVGAIRFTAPSADRNGRGFPPGAYTMRFLDGDSVGLFAAADDQNPETSAIDQLPAPRHLLRLNQGPAGRTPRFEMNSRGEWIVHERIGETPAALLVTGVAR